MILYRIFFLLSITKAFILPIPQRNKLTITVLHLSSSSSSSDEIKKTTEEDEQSIFKPLEVVNDADNKEINKDDDDDNDDEDLFDKVESFGRGSAKKKRGRRKGIVEDVVEQPAIKTTLAPEEVFYEGPPAITETIAPTISIITVLGIIPAAAAWARQAWVRYKITNRRIRVNSGIGGKEMAEIVYPDIVEIRTARRLFGDGDMVAFLRDGAKFEMRNIPNFDETMEFILNQVSPDVASQYRNKGEVTKSM